MWNGKKMVTYGNRDQQPKSGTWRLLLRARNTLNGESLWSQIVADALWLVVTVIWGTTFVVVKGTISDIKPVYISWG